MGQTGVPHKAPSALDTPLLFPFFTAHHYRPPPQHNSIAPGRPSSFLKSSSANTSTQEIPVRTFLSSSPLYFRHLASSCLHFLSFQLLPPFPFASNAIFRTRAILTFSHVGTASGLQPPHLHSQKMLSSLLFAESPLAELASTAALKLPTHQGSSILLATWKCDARARNLHRSQ